MYRTMLVPLDGSKLAEVVFTYARELAGRLDLDMVFLYVSSPDETDKLPMHRSYIEHAAEQVRAQSEEVRKKNAVKGKPVSARGVLVTGYPAEEILRYAESNNIDLIMMATHGRSGLSRWVMGSVADKVLRASGLPVWLVRAGLPEKTIYAAQEAARMLVPLDGSKLAEAVLPHVTEVARLRGSVEVVLLRVFEEQYPMSAVSYYLTPAGYPPQTPLKWEDFIKQENEKLRKAGRQYLEGVAAKLKEAGLKTRIEIADGKPAEAIINYAGKDTFSLIVMSTHGSSGLTRFAYGSVTEKVLYGTTAPVLLVRPKKEG